MQEIQWPIFILGWFSCLVLDILGTPRFLQGLRNWETSFLSN